MSWKQDKLFLMKTSYQEYLRGGGIYAATFDDICIICGEKIGDKKHTITLKLDPNWDKREQFDFNKHCTDELIGYKHFKCLK